jgi:cytochrome P450
MTTVATPNSRALEPDFDPWDPKHLPDPYAVYALMREREPMHWNERRGLWFATKYDDVMPILKDHARLSTAVYHIQKPHMEKAPADGDRYQAFKGSTMITVEPPEQKRLRRGVAPAFSARSMQRLSGRIEAIAEDLLDGLDGRDGMDVIEDYAYPLPILAIAELLGIPPEDQATFMNIVTGDRDANALDPSATEEILAQAAENGRRLGELVRQVIAKKRVEPGEDLISAMIATQEAEELTLGEMTDTVHLMMEAGHITTVNLIGNGLDLLLDRPEDLMRLRREPDLMPAAVDECLRYVGPVHFTGRTALEDLEVGGHLVRKGECIIALLPGANRDPDAFPDPESFIVDRAPNRHLALGIGAHVCIGAALARIETQIAFRKLLDRFPDLHRAGEPHWNTSFEMRGRTTLPVAFGP